MTSWGLEQPSTNDMELGGPIDAVCQGLLSGWEKWPDKEACQALDVKM